MRCRPPECWPLRTGDLERAATHLEQARTAFEEAGEIEGQAQTDILSARVLLLRKKPTEAEPLLTQAFTAADRQLEKRLAAEAAVLIGYIYLKKNPKKTAEWLTRALDRLERESICIELHQAFLVIGELGRSEEAAKLKGAAREFYQTTGTVADPLMGTLMGVACAPCNDCFALARSVIKKSLS